MGRCAFSICILRSFSTPVCPSSPLIINTRLLTFSSLSNSQYICYSKYHPHLFTIDSSCLPSHLCSMSGFALLLLPPSMHKEREEWRSRKKSRPPREEDRVGWHGRYSFSDDEGPTRNGSYVKCVFDILKPTRLLPTQPSVSATLSARMTMASGSITTIPAISTKGGSMPKNSIGSTKKWCVRRQRGSSSTASEVLGTFLHFRFFQAIL